MNSQQPVKVRQAMELREQGMSIRAISQALGMPISTIFPYLRGVGETFYDLHCDLCGHPTVGARPGRRLCDGCRRKNKNEAQRRRRMDKDGDLNRSPTTSGILL